MEWVEVTGRTVEEAKELALDQLGVDAQDAEFEIMEEPRGGLFGRLRSEARVRARVRPTTPRPKEERRERRRRGGQRQERPQNQPGGDDGERGGGRRGPAPSQRQPRPPKQAAETENGEVKDVPLEEQAQVASEFVTGIVERFSPSSTVDIEPVDDDTIRIAVRGGDLGLLIGPKGQTLAALQDLARTVVQRRTAARNGWIVVDVADYREKRRTALARFTREVAERVLAAGVATSLEPMSPADRKIVHDTVNDIEGVSTTSEGEEPRRRVVVMPDRS